MAIGSQRSLLARYWSQSLRPMANGHRPPALFTSPFKGSKLLLHSLNERSVPCRLANRIQIGIVLDPCTISPPALDCVLEGIE
jgi:hypothetical protein